MWRPSGGKWDRNIDTLYYYYLPYNSIIAEGSILDECPSASHTDYFIYLLRITRIIPCNLSQASQASQASQGVRESGNSEIAD